MSDLETLKKKTRLNLLSYRFKSETGDGNGYLLL